MKLSVTVQHPSRKSLYVISMSVVFNVAMATNNFKHTQKSPKRWQKARNVDVGWAESFDCFKRERDICVKTIMPMQPKYGLHTYPPPPFPPALKCTLFLPKDNIKALRLESSTFLKGIVDSSRNSYFAPQNEKTGTFYFYLESQQ